MKKALVILCPLILAACNGAPGYYRTPIVQGNIIEPQKVAQLKTGMTRKQVHYLLGRPLVDPKFEDDRQNYVFYYRNPRAHSHKTKLVLYFQKDKLARATGNKEFTDKFKANNDGDPAQAESDS